MVIDRYVEPWFFLYPGSNQDNEPAYTTLSEWIKTQG